MQATTTFDTSALQSAATDGVTSPRPEDVALLFTELRRPLFRYLMSLGLTAAAAEDIVQEAFLRLCQQFSAGACFNLKPWLFRVAHNLAFDEHRRGKHRLSDIDPTELDQSLAPAADCRATPEQHAIDAQRAAQLEAAMRRLPPHQQHCLHLRAEGLRYREIAEVLGVGTSTVADWVQAALDRLGRDLK